MDTVKTIKDLRPLLDKMINAGDTIGFVPTMGALHAGHVSLVRKSIGDNNATIVSVYVNPTQFNNKDDLKNYPRDLEKDCEILAKEGVSIVFAPNDKEMYPETDPRIFDFGKMHNVMEGKFRPGHFNGVGQIVSKFFEIIPATRAYFGEKDFQQLAIIRKLVDMQGYRIEIVGCPIVREDDGLAMSSRNQLLSGEHRHAAPVIYQTLQIAKKMRFDANIKTIVKFVTEKINSNPYLKLEYFELVNSNTLEAVAFIDPKIPVRACIAVFAGPVRLIDNIDFIS